MDTRSFIPSAEHLPSSVPELYHGNAESFLGIGKAMGEAMLKSRDQ
jgi:hypothetical protein